MVNEWLTANSGQIFDGTANNTRNFSHPGRRARTSLGGSSTHSINAVPDRESAAYAPPTVALAGHGFPPRTTSRSALTEDATNRVHKNDHGGSSPVSDENNLTASLTQVKEQSKEDEDHDFRTVRLSLRSDTPFGPTLRISKEADQFLMGPTTKNSSSVRLRMPSFGTTSSDESVEKEVKAAVMVGEQARARRAPLTEDEYCLTKSITYHEQPDFGSSSTNSAAQVSESAGSRDTSASSSSNKYASIDGSTLVGARTRPIRDRNPSPHAALLFSRALGPGAPINKANILTKSKTSPNLMKSSSSPGSSPPMPPPKDDHLAEKETTAEVVEHENVTQDNAKPATQKQQLGLKTRNLRSTAIPSPVRATPNSDRSWVVNLDSPESRGQTPTQHSMLRRGPAGVARNSMGSGSFNSKKVSSRCPPIAQHLLSTHPPSFPARPRSPPLSCQTCALSSTAAATMSLLFPTSPSPLYPLDPPSARPSHLSAPRQPQARPHLPQLGLRLQLLL